MGQAESLVHLSSENHRYIARLIATAEHNARREAEHRAWLEGARYILQQGDYDPEELVPELSHNPYPDPGEPR